MCVALICWPVGDSINFGINFMLPMKPFSYMTKKSGQKFKSLKNEKKLKHEK